MYLSTLSEKVSRNIKRLRAIKGLTQVNLARASGISEIQMQRIEQCRGGTTIKTLEKIAKVLNEPPEAFFHII